MTEKILQEWEGVIKEIVGEIVYAQLVNLTAGDTQAEEYAEMTLSQFLKPGTIFRWRIVRNADNEVISDVELYRGKFKPQERRDVVHYMRDRDGSIECTVRAIKNPKTTRDRAKVTCKRCLFDLERTVRILGGE